MYSLKEVRLIIHQQLRLTIICHLVLFHLLRLLIQSLMFIRETIKWHLLYGSHLQYNIHFIQE